MIDIKSYAKKKPNVTNKNGFAGSNTVQIVNTGESTDTSIRGCYLWNNWVDLTEDVNGSLVVDGSVNARGFSGTNANILYINSTDITTQGLTTQDLTVTELAQIYELLAGEITCESLTVTKAAHFFKLIIDEVKAAQGQIILTPANAVIDKVEPFTGGDYKCYFKATDGDEQILQCFEIYDQLVCETFNAADGVSYDVDNKYYWRLVTDVSSQPVLTTINGVQYLCHWFVLSNSDKDTYSNGVPEVGDNVVLLGNRYDTTRQAAITIGAYNNPFLDSGIKAPFIIQYDGISNYDLSSHRKNVISRQLNYLTASNTYGNNLFNTSGWKNADLTPCTYDKDFFNYSTTAKEIGGHYYYEAYSPIIYVEPGDYVFSYYSEFSPDVFIKYSQNIFTNPLLINSYITPNSTGTLSDDIYLDNPRKYVKFTVSTACYICISVGLQNSDEYDLFEKPQLEFGTDVTKFDDSAASSQSQIVMTKDEILLGVNQTGIDIQNHLITLDSSNTVINGDLRINSTSTGFVFLDSSGNITTILDNDNIGEFSSSELYVNEFQMDIPAGTSTKESGIVQLGDDSIDVYKLYKDTTIDFSSLQVVKDNENFNEVIDIIIYKYIGSGTPSGTNYPYGNAINANWEYKKMFTRTISGTDRVDFVNSGDLLRYAIPEDGYYCMTFKITNRPNTSVSAHYELTADYYINQSTYTHIAQNGVNLNSKNYSFMTLSDLIFKMRYKNNEIILGDSNASLDEIIIKNGDNRIVVGEDTIEFDTNNNQIVIDKTTTEIQVNNKPYFKLNARTETGTTVTATKIDQFIIIDNNAATTLNLDQTTAKWDGHQIIVKHKNAKSVSVVGSVMDYDSGSVITNKSWNDYVPRMFVYLGGVWYISKLG